MYWISRNRYEKLIFSNRLNKGFICIILPKNLNKKIFNYLFFSYKNRTTDNNDVDPLHARIEGNEIADQLAKLDTCSNPSK